MSDTTAFPMYAIPAIVDAVTAAIAEDVAKELTARFQHNKTRRLVPAGVLIRMEEYTTIPREIYDAIVTQKTSNRILGIILEYHDKDRDACLEIATQVYAKANDAAPEEVRTQMLALITETIESRARYEKTLQTDPV